MHQVPKGWVFVEFHPLPEDGDGDNHGRFKVMGQVGAYKNYGLHREGDRFLTTIVHQKDDPERLRLVVVEKGTDDPETEDPETEDPETEDPETEDPETEDPAVTTPPSPEN